MGICASSHLTKKGGGINWPSRVKVIHPDGRHQEFRQPIKASHVLSHNPNCFLCSSEAMYVGSRAPHVPGDEELQLGQIYFLMSSSKSETPLSLQDLCALAIKATTVQYLDENNSVRVQGCYRIPSGCELGGLNSQMSSWQPRNPLL